MAMPTTPTSATPVTPTPMGHSGNFLSLASSLIFTVGFVLSLCLSLVNLCSTSYFFPGSTPFEVAQFYQFEISSSFATVFDPASKAATFFIEFNQLETNDLDLRTSGVLDPLMFTFMVFRFLRSASPLCLFSFPFRPTHYTSLFL